MTSELLRVALRADRDVVVARQRARDIARHLGLDAQEQIRVATAVSEVARNAVEHGGGGSVQFAVALAPVVIDRAAMHGFEENFEMFQAVPVMRSHRNALADAGINIALINTSEVRVNVLTDLERGKEALACLERSFATERERSGAGPSG